jgi:PIN domain nuclease of toxin-antitoxin system
METIIYLDTHVVVWLFAGEKHLFNGKTLELLGKKSLRISPIVELELQYLFETGRITITATNVLSAMNREIGLVRCSHPFNLVVRQALIMDWTRDLFDRLIVGQAAVNRSRLCAKDRSILDHCQYAFWE